MANSITLSKDLEGIRGKLSLVNQTIFRADKVGGGRETKTV